MTKTISARKLVRALCFGQVLSLLLCGTAVTSGLLQEHNVSIPTAQSFLNYVLLGLIYAPMLACRKNKDNILVILRERGWKYLLLGIIDVEGNYLIVNAYHYTTVTSVQLLDCFTIPVVLILSWLILKVKYKLVHIIGVLVCLAGVGSLVGADILTNKNGSEQAVNMVLGDLLCLGGATLYGISNVAEEFVVKSFDQVEFLGMIGIFGSLISGLQVGLLERDAVSEVDFTSYKIVLLLLGFVACLFFYYTFLPVVIKATSAATVNLNILSADFYSLLFGIFLFRYTFHPLYYVAFVLILGGVVVYCSKETPQRVTDQNDTTVEHLQHIVEEPPTTHSRVSDEDEVNLTVHAEESSLNATPDVSPDEKTPLNTNG
ncbi:solute carrier family 35 member F2-like isoform X2 [Lineus longissimus]|uniref:solute carrier family 35 member F2-like isoform X2 n=1 Tax=Lineus longissimus TaxID=88925 RepID=UPI00315DFC11